MPRAQERVSVAKELHTEIERLADRQVTRDCWSRQERHVANDRLAVFSASLIMVVFFYMYWLGPVSLIVSLLLFVGLVLAHRRLRRRSRFRGQCCGETGRSVECQSFYDSKGLKCPPARVSGVDSAHVTLALRATLTTIGVCVQLMAPGPWFSLPHHQYQPLRSRSPGLSWSRIHEAAAR
jgi:hypothetical protein